MLDGLVVVDKATDWTSHDVVAKCRGIFGQKRVGHSGTLDPDATGVLLVGLGRVTRLLRFLTDLPKSYIGEVVLGVETSTLDAAGEVTARHDMADVTLEDVRTAAGKFVGEIMQVPPMVSAVKVGGKRLHALAREGVEVEREPRPVTIHSLVVNATDDPLVFAIEVDCSSGTYIRTLAADLGAALGGGGHLRALRRTAIGSFGVEEARSLDALGVDHVLEPAEALRDYPSVIVGAEIAEGVSHGRTIPPSDVEGPVRVLDESGRMLAVYDGSRPLVVLAAE